MSKEVQTKFRIQLLILGSLGIAVIILLRFAFIMLSSGRERAAPSPLLRSVERGPILDRNGKLLALQTHLFSVSAWKPEIEDLENTATLLSGILNKTSEEIRNSLTSTSSRFVFIERKVRPSQSDAIATLIENDKLPGINLQQELGRHYPMKRLAAGLIGYVGTDNVGLDGIEYAFDRVLAPAAISSGNQVSYGHKVRLTLDINAQYLVEKIADEAWETHRPDSMMILVMDAKNGEILVWVSRPSFDPNKFTEFDRRSRMNLPLVMAYEPGSAFKAFIWSILLDQNKISKDDLFDTRSAFEPKLFRENRISPITDLGNFGIVDLAAALSRSSNIAVAQASQYITDSELYKSLRNFGFGTPTALPLPGESHGLLRPSDDWSIRSRPTIAIGQEVGVSAIQITAAASVLTNGGILVQPRIVKDVVAADGALIKEYKYNPIREVISPRTAKMMLELMEGTVNSPAGTSRLAAVPGLRISAKSGTAQITDPVTGKYSEDRFLSSVLAIFPTEDPRLIAYAVLENPQGTSIYGAQTAAPMIKDIATALSPVLGIPIAGNSIINHRGSVEIIPPEIQPLGEVLHDMTGYSKRMLLGYLERDDIEWNIDGDGWVVFQFPPPGTAVESGMSIFLELK